MKTTVTRGTQPPQESFTIHLKRDVVLRAMDDRGLPTQKALIAATGFSKPTIRRALKGWDVTWKTAIGIADTLGLTPNQVVSVNRDGVSFDLRIEVPPRRR